MTAGYFSVIQFCPDRSRMETVNVGLVLLVPSVDFLGVEIDADCPENQIPIRSMKSRIENDRERLIVRDSLENFIATRANDLRMTSLRYVRADDNDPDRTLRYLFDRLVAAPADERLQEAWSRQSRRTLAKMLEEDEE